MILLALLFNSMEKTLIFTKCRNGKKSSRLLIQLAIVILIFFSISSIIQSPVNNYVQIDSNSMSARQVFDYFLWTNRLSCRLVHDFGGRIVRDLKLENPSGIDGQKAVCLVIYLQIMIGHSFLIKLYCNLQIRTHLK